MLESLNTLLQQPRLSYFDDCKGVNMLNGLLDLIHDHIDSEFEVAEIGSFEGKSTELFAMFAKKVWSIDPYEPYGEIPYNKILEAEPIFLEMQSRHTNIQKVKKRSVEAAPDFADASLDAVYIDAAHDYGSFKADLLAWAPKVKPGGIISGHDYSGLVENFGCVDVNQAIAEVFPGIQIYTYSDTSWAIKKPL